MNKKPKHKHTDPGKNTMLEDFAKGGKKRRCKCGMQLEADEEKCQYCRALEAKND